MSAVHPVSPAWVAVDWGTSNLRAFAMDAQGAVLAEARSDAGMGSLAPKAFEGALRDVLAQWHLPVPCTVVACGMVGSRQGWFEAPYRAVPCAARASGAVRVPDCGEDLQVYLLPGVKQMQPADVMRGEETQIAGFLSLNRDWDGVICLPGSHSKWVHVSAGEIVSFRTCMTGELFAAISGHTVLKHSLGSEDWDASAFETALSETLSRPETLAGRLFSLRAAGLLHGLSGGAARAALSGALIGAELAACKPYWLGQRVALIGAGALCELYAGALQAQSVICECADVTDVTRAGLASAYANL